MHRLFVALRPPPAIRALLAATQGGVPHARWQDDDQLHLTVRYIGEVERPVAEEVALALGQIHAPAPTVALAGVGAFDKQGRVDTLWAGVAPHDALAALHRKVDQALVRIGLDPERRAYLPHITLARLPRSAGADPAIERWRARPCRRCRASRSCLDALILYESRLGRDGAQLRGGRALSAAGSEPRRAAACRLDNFQRRSACGQAGSTGLAALRFWTCGQSLSDCQYPPAVSPSLVA